MLFMVCVEATMLSQVHTNSRRSRLSGDIQDIPSWCLGKAPWRALVRASVRRNTRNPGLAKYSHEWVHLKPYKEDHGEGWPHGHHAVSALCSRFVKSIQMLILYVSAKEIN